MKIKERIIDVKTGKETIIYYTQAELDTIAAKEAADQAWYTQWAVHIQYLKDLKAVYDARIAEYGSPEEQLDYMYDHGFDGYLQRQNDIKARHPKPDMVALGITQAEIDTMLADPNRPADFINPLTGER